MLALDDRELIRWCGEHGTGVVSYGPLGYGLLTGTVSRERAVSASDWRRSDEGPFTDEKLDRDLVIVEGLRPIAERLGITHGPARAGVERRPAGRHVGDRGQPRPRLTRATTRRPGTSSSTNRR